MKTLSLDLPWPPSVNHYWRSIMSGPLAGRVLISKRGREYRDEVRGVAYEQQAMRSGLTGKLAVHITAWPPDRRARDLDNLTKGILDSLQHAKVIHDDADIDDLHLVRGPVRAGGVVQVRISEIAGAATQSGELFQVPRGATA